MVKARPRSAHFRYRPCTLQAMLLGILLLLCGSLSTTLISAGHGVGVGNLMDFHRRSVCSSVLIGNCSIVIVDVQKDWLVRDSNILADKLDVHETATLLYMQIANETFRMAGTALDTALITRPWWTVLDVVMEPIHASNRGIIVLRRLPTMVTNLLMKLIAFNSPSPSDCENRPLMVSLHDGDTWGNRYINVKSDIEFCFRYGPVFTAYVTTSGSIHDKVYFSGGNDCLTHVNKWECLFLPQTNCSYPQKLLSCSTRDCLPEPWSSGLYSFAATAGELIHESDREAIFTEKAGHPKPKPTAKEPFTLNFIPRERFVAMKSTALPVFIMTEAVVTQMRDSDISASSLLYHLIASRFNFNFRSKLETIKHQVRSEHPILHRDADCVTLHIRMDDRSKPGVDIDAWCNRCAIFDDQNSASFTYEGRTYRHRARFNDSCTEYNEGQYDDFGCNTDLPYGMATLEHYLNASRALRPNVSDVFIMTDDMNWFHEQRGKYTEQQRISEGRSWTPKMHLFPLRPNHRVSSLQAAEDFWASVSIAEQCSAFVGSYTVVL
jgi:hypothetical protein